eukprot:CAMPEP_0195617530 /NCGR_PEP_ID=MMETSP0815-20121206/13602_1 /TAXON_ID=97485 /ORGANISM="Prymnesium parvum, Strain Texoma1" /LENGTH=107 /DNA_ID=CAMNT_0040758013 /DNA_START=1105 /DNA_END=1428 /DNA_ORIENTATION=-
MVDVRDPKDVHLFLADREVREFLETGELAKFALRCKENLGRRERLLDELLDFVRVRHVPYEQRESGRAPTRQRHAEVSNSRSAGMLSRRSVSMESVDRCENCLALAR